MTRSRMKGITHITHDMTRNVETVPVMLPKDTSSSSGSELEQTGFTCKLRMHNCLSLSNQYWLLQASRRSKSSWPSSLLYPPGGEFKFMFSATMNFSYHSLGELVGLG